MKVIELLAMTSIALASGAYAQTAPASEGDHASHHGAASAQVTAPQSEGEVRKVDREQGKLTLRHGPLENLSMPAMTMVFKVSDPKMLDGLKEGDKVRFTVEKVNGALTVTALQPAR